MTLDNTTPSLALRTLNYLPALSEGAVQRVRRGWPSPRGGVHAEIVDSEGKLRAIHISDSAHTTLLPHACDPLLPSLQAHSADILAVHRFGKRAVTISPTHVRKHLREGKSHKTAAAWRAMSEVCHRANLNTPRLDSVDDHGMTFHYEKGTTLHDLGDAGIEGWWAFAELWVDVATQPQRLRPYTPHDEAHTLNTWWGYAQQHGALPTGDLSRAIDCTTAELLDPADCAPLASWVTTHRDLHDKQLLWDGKRLTLLDADTAVNAEAAVDLGNLRAHIDLRITQGTLSPHLRNPLMDLCANLAHTLKVSESRLRTYENSARLRLACVYAFRPEAHAWLPQWLDSTLHHATTCGNDPKNS